MRPPMVLALFLLLFVLGFGAYEGVSLLTGDVTSRLVIVETIPDNCSFFVNEGWNLVGLSCKPNDRSPAALYADSGNQIISIHAYAPDDLNDPWKVYNPSLPAWVVQDLSTLDRYNGYWIRSQSNASVSFNGSVKVPTVMLLPQGWNLIGYPLLEQQNITLALATLEGKYTIVYSYNESDGDWKVFSPNLTWSEQDFKYMKPHEGFWINLTEMGEWHVG